MILIKTKNYKKYRFTLIKVILLPLFYTNIVIACEKNAILEKIQQESLNVYFEQSKIISVLPKPLISRGKIWQSEENAIVWQVTYPIKSTTVIKAAGMVQFDRNDKIIEQNNSFQSNQLVNLLLDVASVNFTKLSASFEMSWDCDNLPNQPPSLLGNSWSVDLTPKDKSMKKFLTKITMSGNERLNFFSYQEVRGDVTKIQLKAESQSFAEELRIYLK